MFSLPWRSQSWLEDIQGRRLLRKSDPRTFQLNPSRPTALFRYILEIPKKCSFSTLVFLPRPTFLSISFPRPVETPLDTFFKTLETDIRSWPRKIYQFLPHHPPQICQNIIFHSFDTLQEPNLGSTVICRSHICDDDDGFLALKTDMFCLCCRRHCNATRLGRITQWATHIITGCITCKTERGWVGNLSDVRKKKMEERETEKGHDRNRRDKSKFYKAHL